MSNVYRNRSSILFTQRTLREPRSPKVRCENQKVVDGHTLVAIQIPVFTRRVRTPKVSRQEKKVSKVDITVSVNIAGYRQFKTPQLVTVLAVIG